ncbi:MAG: M56 family metallopeptidase [Muribaculaceae bacterium]|nr:M56 family metallopeptidase [Muribaculaceae bacterium]
MGNVFGYSLASSLPLAVMYLVYKWLLASENQHRCNRVVLWLICVGSLALPVVADKVPDIARGAQAVGGDVEFMMPEIAFGVAGGEEAVWPVVLLAVYMAGMVLCAGLTLVTFIRLVRVVANGERLPMGKYTVVITRNDNIAPFSWWRYIVMSRTDFEESGKVIALHEVKHLDCRHWIDLLAAQLLVVFQWYNPAAWLIREELKTVHEYQADEAVLRSGADARQYQMLLIKKAVGARFPSLANSLNHSKLKKRITMMYQSKSSAGRRLRALALIPAAAVAVAVAGIPAVASVISDASHATVAPDNGKVTEIQQKPQELSGLLAMAKASDSGRQTGASGSNVVKAAEQMPRFKGGESEMIKFLASNINYPEKAKKDKTEGRVVVRFVVSETGKVEKPEIVRSVSPELDAEALRVVGMMPDFTPGTVDGKPVACSYVLPVQFALQ